MPERFPQPQETDPVREANIAQAAQAINQQFFEKITGQSITLRDQKDQQLKRVIVGQPTPSVPGFYFVHIPNETVGSPKSAEGILDSDEGDALLDDLLAKTDLSPEDQKEVKRRLQHPTGPQQS